NAPTASFAYTVLAGGAVQFTDTSAGEPTSWQWTFPGGTFTGRTPPAQVIPARTPPWPVALTVTNPAGTSTVSLPVVVNGPPVAATAPDPDGTVAAIDWDVDGDGKFNDGTGPVVTRTFGTPGSRVVSVRATDNAGVATIAFRTIEVTGSSQGPSGAAAASGAA